MFLQWLINNFFFLAPHHIVVLCMRLETIKLSSIFAHSTNAIEDERILTTQRLFAVIVCATSTETLIEIEIKTSLTWHQTRLPRDDVVGDEITEHSAVSHSALLASTFYTKISRTFAVDMNTNVLSQSNSALAAGSAIVSRLFIANCIVSRMHFPCKWNSNDKSKFCSAWNILKSIKVSDPWKVEEFSLPGAVSITEITEALGWKSRTGN